MSEMTTAIYTIGIRTIYYDTVQVEATSPESALATAKRMDEADEVNHGLTFVESEYDVLSRDPGTKGES